MYRKSLDGIFICLFILATMGCQTLTPQTEQLLNLSQQKEPDRATMKQLIAAGADINARNRDGATALYLASCKDDLETVQLLTGHGANVNIPTTKKGNTPLHCAALNGHPQIVKHLLAHGADVNTMMASGWTPLLFACLSKNHKSQLQVVRLLIENGAHVDLGDRKDGFTPLYTAAEGNHLDVVKFLVEHGANVNKRIDNGRTPLYAAASEGNLEIVMLLISEGADVNVIDKWGEAPLLGASDEGYTDVAKVLLDHGADANTKSNDGFSPLYLASQNGNLGVVKALIAQGANIDDVYSEYNMTPLWKAAHKGRLDVVKVLLDSGANKDIEANYLFNSATPAEIAREMGHHDIYRLISNYK